MNKIHNLSQATGAILLLTVIFVSVTQSVLSLFAIEFQWILPVAAGAAAVLTSIWSDYYLTALKGIAMSLLMLAAAVAWKFAMPSLDMMGVLLMEASAFILFDLIGKIGRPSPAGSRRALVMLFICNPAVLSTVYREGTDMTFYYCMLITVALVYQLWYHGRLRDWVLLTGTVIVAFSNGKDIIVLEGCVLLLAIHWCAVNRRKAFAWKLLLAGTLSLIFAFCIYGYNPAVSDFIAQGYVLPGHGEPVYPRAEESGIYLEYNRFTTLLISLIDLAHPFRGSWSHGFGPLMPIIIIISVIALIKYCNILPYVVWVTIIAAVASCFIFEQSWQPRYISQLWLLPSVTALAMKEYPHLRWATGTRDALEFLGILAAVISLIVVTVRHFPLPLK